MRICLASIHPRMLSGQIEGLVALADQLRALGQDVKLVSAFAPALLQSNQRWAAESGDSAPISSKLVRIGGIVRSIVRAARDCDVLHFNVPTPAFSGLADTVRLLTQRPLVVGFEAHLADVRSALARVPAAPEFYGPRVIVNNGLVARMTLHLGTHYVVSSDYQKRELAALGYQSSRLRVIPNLIDTRKLSHRTRAEARAALGLPDAPLAVFAGHYHDVKGHDVLIRAFPQVLAGVPKARLVLAWSGTGNHARVATEIARAGIEHAVIELGRVHIGDLFSAANVVALPYRFSIGQAAFPGTVLEAMWVGVPLVTTRLPLLSELVEHQRTGLLAAPGDSHELGAHLSQLLRDEALQTQMVEAQHQLIEQRFAPEHLAQAYLRVYEEARAGQARLLQTA